MVEDTENCLLASIGGIIAPIFAPLGFGNWRAVASSLSGFTAKESIVTTMAVLAGTTEEAENLAQAVGVMFPSAIAAVSFLVFNMLNSPCLAAISTMAKEMNDRKWFWFAVVFQNVFAYAIALIVYQIGMVVSGGGFGVGTVAAIIVLIFLLYMLFRPDPYKNKKIVAKRSVA